MQSIEACSFERSGEPESEVTTFVSYRAGTLKIEETWL
jgi:hypothetical protein